MKPAPTLAAVLALFLLACGCGPGDRGNTLYVYTASSTRDAIEEIARAYERDHGGKVVLNTGSSGWLSVQIEQGGRADVFLSAGEHEMDRLQELGLVLEDSRVALLSNQLVVIVPMGERRVEQPTDLAADWVERLSIANPGSVPAGRYAKAWLQSAGLWDAVRDKLLPGVNVRAALAAVEHGGAHAGIVYSTDASIAREIEVTYRIPLREGPQITYPAAAMADRPREKRARAFVEYMATAAAQSVFEHYGFLGGGG